MTYKIIGGDGREYGPVTDAELRKWIAEGRLNAQSLAKAEGDAEFHPLSTFPEFADIFGAAASMPETISPAPAMDWSNRDYQLDIGGCIGRGWTLFMDQIGILLGGSVLYLLIIFGIAVAMGAVFGVGLVALIPKEMLHSPTFTITQNIFFRLLATPLFGPLTGGFYYLFIQTVRGQPAGVGDLFIGFQRAFMQLFLGYLILTAVSMLCFLPFSIVETLRVQPVLEHFRHSPTPEQMRGLMPELWTSFASTLPVGILCLIPAAYLLTNLLFVLPLIIDQGMDLGMAIKTSWKMVHKHWLTVFGLFLLTGLINFAGILLCCVGMLFTLAITTAALMAAYEIIFCERRPS